MLDNLGRQVLLILTVMLSGPAQALSLTMLVPAGFFQEGGGYQGLEPFLAVLEARGDTLKLVPVPDGQPFVEFACRELKQGKLDLVWIDSIHSGVLAPYAFDLNRLPQVDRQGFFPQFVAAHTHGGKLVALPIMADVGVLVYRRDLLRNLGETGLPSDWDGLASLARRVQDSQRRQGQHSFWGFWFRAEPSENLTALLLEWSDPDDNQLVWEQSQRYLARAAVWLQTFVPADVLYETEPQGVARFLAGDLFMTRTWVQGAGEIKSQLPPGLEVDLAAVPGGGALGGHGVMVAARSPNAAAAADWAAELASYRFQRSLALASRLLPARMAVYSDPGVRQARPEIGSLLPLFISARLRPHDVLGAAYPRFSRRVQVGLRMALIDPASSGRAAADIRTAYHAPTGADPCSP